MSGLELAPEQWLAYRQAVVQYCLGTLRQEFGQQGAPTSEVHVFLSKSAQIGVSQLRERCLSDFGSVDELLPWVLQSLKRPQLLGPLGEWFGGAWQEAVSRIQSSNVPLSNAMDRAAFMAAFDWFFNKGGRKARWAHALVHNAEYQEMITGVLYEMIRQFFQEEALLSKLPGVGQFLKMGRWGAGKVLPQWERIVAESTKSFLAKNLTAVLRLSERFLLDGLNDDRIQMLGEQAWLLLSERAPSELAGATQVLGDPALKQWTAAHWSALVEGPFWEDIIVPVVRVVLEALSKITCGELWSALDLPESQLVDWNKRVCSLLLVDLANNAEIVGFLSELMAPCFSDAFLQSALGSESVVDTVPLD